MFPIKPFTPRRTEFRSPICRVRDIHNRSAPHTRKATQNETAGIQRLPFFLHPIRFSLADPAAKALRRPLRLKFFPADGTNRTTFHATPPLRPLSGHAKKAAQKSCLFPFRSADAANRSISLIWLIFHLSEAIKLLLYPPRHVISSFTQAFHRNSRCFRPSRAHIFTPFFQNLQHYTP